MLLTDEQIKEIEALNTLDHQDREDFEMVRDLLADRAELINLTEWHDMATDPPKPEDGPILVLSVRTAVFVCEHRNGAWYDKKAGNGGAFGFLTGDRWQPIRLPGKEK
jgi:hypothetical protein